MMDVKLVATVSSFEELKFTSPADVIEIRVDLLDSAEPEMWTGLDKETIITCRREIDGGGYRGNEDERVGEILKWVEVLNPEYVDLEYDLRDDDFRLFNNVNVIESYHNFKETPEYGYLKDLIENSRGEIFKIATMGRERKDVKVVARLMCEYDNTVAFLMGEEFRFTRMLSAMLGSPFIYCFAGRSKAPGQIELREAEKILSMLGLR